MAQQHADPPRDLGSAVGYDAAAGAGPDPDPAGPIDITPGPFAEDRGGLEWTDDGAEPAPAAGRKSSPVRRVALGALLVVGIAGTAVLGTSGWRIMQQKDAVLEPPAAVGALTRDESEDATATAASLRTALSAGIDLDETVAVVYADPTADGRSVFLFGGTGLLFSPAKDLDEVLRLLGEPADGAAGMREVEPGELGGVMKCGRVNAPDETMSACGWADHGSVAVAMFPDREVADAASLMRDLRAATQKRS
jgi:hypothetical protein